jgi:hypothetical protein
MLINSKLPCVSSPVDCIHWTSAAQLSLLEDEMRRVERVNVRKISEIPIVLIVLQMSSQLSLLDYPTL